MAAVLAMVNLITLVILGNLIVMATVVAMAGMLAMIDLFTLAILGKLVSVVAMP